MNIFNFVVFLYFTSCCHECSVETLDKQEIGFHEELVCSLRQICYMTNRFIMKVSVYPSSEPNSTAGFKTKTKIQNLNTFVN